MKTEVGENKQDIVNRRNWRLAEFWLKTQLPVRIIGNENSPAIIFDEKWILSCYVKNFNLIFKDSPFDGNDVMSIKLTVNPEYKIQDFIMWLSKSKHRPIYKIKLIEIEPKLYLVGYNFLNSAMSENRYPVFATYNPKLYFSEESAIQKVDEMRNLGYDVVAVKPTSDMIDIKKYSDKSIKKS